MKALAITFGYGLPLGVSTGVLMYNDMFFKEGSGFGIMAIILMALFGKKTIGGFDTKVAESNNKTLTIGYNATKSVMLSGFVFLLLMLLRDSITGLLVITASYGAGSVTAAPFQMKTIKKKTK